MGTPAFPNLGKHCGLEECRQIDFLPFTCDCCQQVFCLDHRSYTSHQCPKANKADVTVVVCPLCARGVRLVPDQDPNIIWESHVNVECDPSNYAIAMNKKKCPVPRCKETLTFSNKIKCRDCNIEHCLKHRFGADHNCPGPKKPESVFQLMSSMNRDRNQDPKRAAPTSSSSSNWASAFSRVASSLYAKAEAGISKLGNDFNQAVSTSGAADRTTTVGNPGPKAGASSQVEICPQCKLRFSNIGALVEHVEKVHERNGVMKVTLDVCPKCSKGFRDPVALVEHVERDHGGASKA